jgi:tripartite-type tricarboxylate transporter receptor subunit TctC
VISLPEASNWLQEEGAKSAASRPDELTQKIRNDMAEWAKVIKQARTQPQ